VVERLKYINNYTKKKNISTLNCE